MRHFLDLRDFDRDRLNAMLETAAQMKAGEVSSMPLAGKSIGMIFEKFSFVFKSLSDRHTIINIFLRAAFDSEIPFFESE